MTAANPDRPAATAGNVGTAAIGRSMARWNVLGYVFTRGYAFTSSSFRFALLQFTVSTRGPASPRRRGSEGGHGGAARLHLGPRTRRPTLAAHTSRARIGHIRSS